MVRRVSIWIMLILGVAVIEAQALTRTLAWEAPLTNTDGTPVAVTVILAPTESSDLRRLSI